MELQNAFEVSQGEGAGYWSLGGLLMMKATGEQTGGEFALIEGLIAPGGNAPFHIHRNEDESWYVLEGSVTFYVGDQTIYAKAGSFVYGPRGVRHGFMVTGDAPARVLVLSTPSGFENFSMEIGQLAPSLTLPPPELPDFEKLARVAAKYGVDLLGPLPIETENAG